MEGTVVKEECECEMNVHSEELGKAPGEVREDGIHRVKEEIESVEDGGPPVVKLEDDSEPCDVKPPEPEGPDSGATDPIELKTETKKIFVCWICGIKFAASSFLESHVHIRHRGYKPFACIGCEYTCKHPTDLKRHLMIHTGEKPYACNLCDYKSRHLGTLKRHQMRSSHSRTELLCHSCNYRARSVKQLNRHVLSHSVSGRCWVGYPQEEA